MLKHFPFLNKPFRFIPLYGWLSLPFWLLLAAPAWAELELRVAIKQGVNQLTIGSSTPAIVKDSDGKELGELPAMAAVSAQARKDGVKLKQWQPQSLWLEPTDAGHVFVGDRWYRGRVLLVPKDQGLIAVNHVDLEQYLYSVLGGEMSGSWPQEALKAQAVAARSYALYKRQRSATALYDLGHTTSAQIYRGLVDESVGTRTAVDATAGQVLTHGGKIIEAVFHSSSGGHTENVEDIWRSSRPYLRAVQDFDQTAPVYQWTKTFSSQELGQKLAGIGPINALTPERVTPQGRVVTLRATGKTGSQLISGNDFRKRLGLRSTLFSVTKGKNNQFQIKGRGYGHGVGMSQWGARNLADNQGKPYQAILAHYYRNTVLSKIQIR